MTRGGDRRYGFLSEAIEAASSAPEDSLGFQARLWAQVALPYRNPGDVPFWERRNGALSLSIQPALLRENGRTVTGYPYGLIPRLLLVWMATEVVRTRERQLVLGPSLRQFTEQLGLGGATGGRTGSITRLREQIQRLAGSRITVMDERVTDGRSRNLMASIQVATEWDLWFSKSDGGQQPLWPSSVTLSQEFFESIIAAPLPIRLDHLAALRQMHSSGMSIDIYVWLAARMYTLRQPVTITWTDLAKQFGADYTRTRDFAAQFRSQLALVQLVYTTLRADVGPKGITLYPSPTPIPTRTRHKITAPTGLGRSGLAR
jgi:hypothetical protein